MIFVFVSSANWNVRIRSIAFFLLFVEISLVPAIKSPILRLGDTNATRNSIGKSKIRVELRNTVRSSVTGCSVRKSTIWIP
jgi:hypothetical protein